jgi:hypothetical protein
VLVFDQEEDMPARKAVRKSSNGIGRPKSNEYMVVRTVYLPASLDFWLRRKAQAANKTRGEVIRDLLLAEASG